MNVQEEGRINMTYDYTFEVRQHLKYIRFIKHIIAMKVIIVSIYLLSIVHFSDSFDTRSKARL